MSLYYSTHRDRKRNWNADHLMASTGVRAYYGAGLAVAAVPEWGPGAMPLVGGQGAKPFAH